MSDNNSSNILKEYLNHKDDNNILNSLIDNLELLTLLEKSNKQILNKQISNKEISNKQKMSDKYFNKLVTIYNKIYLQAYHDNINNDIYHLLKNIAKKKYFKNERFAKFQEDFFQDFIKDKNGLYDEKLHNKLIEIRDKVNKNTKN